MRTFSTRTIGSFAIERELGSGGMGVVLLGRHATLERRAVLKRLRPEFAQSDELVERFAREARAAAAVHHQNVVAVYDWISWRGEHYIAQEYVDGVDLRAALARVGRFPWRIAALIALELARGLEAIHARAMVHRDLKPANVLIERSGRVVITDFGIARGLQSSDATLQTGGLLGTPAYMAPEQIAGELVDARADLYSLGCILYELLTGQRPFVRSNPSQLAWAHLKTAPEPPSRLVEGVERCRGPLQNVAPPVCRPQTRRCPGAERSRAPVRARRAKARSQPSGPLCSSVARTTLAAVSISAAAAAAAPGPAAVATRTAGRAFTAPSLVGQCAVVALRHR